MNFARRSTKTSAVLAICAIAGLFIFVKDWKRDFTTNHAKLDATAKNPLLRPISLECSREEAVDATKIWLNAQQNWKLISESQESEISVLNLTRETKVMRFVDDIRLEIHSESEGVRIEASSQSRIGLGDLGQNPRNLIEISDGLRAATP